MLVIAVKIKFPGSIEERNSHCRKEVTLYYNTKLSGIKTGAHLNTEAF